MCIGNYRPNSVEGDEVAQKDLYLDCLLSLGFCL